MASGGLGLPGGLDHDINQEELDFTDLFLFNSAEEFPVGPDKDAAHALLPNNPHPAVLVMDCPSAYHLSSSPQPQPSQDLPADHPVQFASPAGLPFHPSRPSTIPAPSPRIEITPSGDSLTSQSHTQSPGPKALSAYRECVSPASSNSSTGWPTENYSPQGSPCPSPSNGAGLVLSAVDLCPGLQAIHTSSAHSSPGGSAHNSVPDDTFLLPHQPNVPPSSRPHQRSRSLSPQGKRSYDQQHSCPTPVKQRSRSPSPSPVPSPHEQQGSYYLHQYQSATPVLREMLSSANNSIVMPSVVPHAPHRPAPRQDCVYGEGYDWALEPDRTVRTEAKPEAFYVVPTVWPPPHPTHHGAFSVSMTPLPSLEWQLPSELGQYKLQIQQHPKSYHRAHYETEGSRGAVKTSSGGHPEVQLFGYHGSSALSLQVFIGTADERLLKPHSFYQVHRVTGKTVTTPSVERIINGTKVLEIPLEPKNNMRVMIDCVGILKLRNADIELRNGETDIGRKNTRVRLVFRVHIPEPSGQLMSLQVCSQPIECSQRAQEMPTVERQDLDRCSVLGGQQMVLTGLNFTIDSRVIFTERNQDGEQIWEAEATVDRDKTQSNMLFVEVPPYRDQRICRPVKVNFCVINGKKNMSQLQHFTYTPRIAIKAEPVDDYQVNYGYPENPAVTGLQMKSLYQHHLDQDSSLQALGVSPTLYNHLSTVDTRFHGLLPDPVDPHYYPYGSCPVLYHNQRSKNPPTMLSSTAHQTKLTIPCEANQDGDVLESFFMTKSRNQSLYETLLPLGKSPTSRYTQVCRQELSREPLKQNSAGRSDLEETERNAVKQENISYAYLEDVNDIIRRDLKDHNGE